MLPILSSHLCRFLYFRYMVPMLPTRKLQCDGAGGRGWLSEVTSISKAELRLNPLTLVTSPLTSKIIFTFIWKHPCPQNPQSGLCLSLAQERKERELSCYMRNLNWSKRKNGLEVPRYQSTNKDRLIFRDIAARVWIWFRLDTEAWMRRLGNLFSCLRKRVKFGNEELQNSAWSVSS